MKKFFLCILFFLTLIINSSCSISKDRVVEAIKTGKVTVIKSWVGTDTRKSNSTDSSGYSFLHLAILADQPASVTALLALGADPEVLGPSGHTALLLALSNKKSACAMILLERNSDIKAINKKDSGKTALHYAAINGLFDCATLLVGKGHVVDVFDNIKATPLNWAAWVSTLEMVKFLVSKGADPYAVDNYGDAPLDSARENPDKAVQEYLENLSKK